MNHRYTDIMFKTLFECSPDACLLIENNHFIKCNPAAVTMLRAKSKEQIYNTHPSALSPATQLDGRNSYEKAEEMITYAIQKGSHHFEWLHKRMDGEEFPVDVSLTLIKYGEKIVIYTVWRDISDRKRAEAEVLEKEAQIRLLLQSTAEGIYGSDINGICTFCNPSGLQLLGYEREDQLLGKKIHELIHHTRPDGTNYPADECRAFDAYRSTRSVHVDDELFWRSDGSSFHVEYWSHPIIENAATKGTVVAFIDITARKEATEALFRSEHLLLSIIDTQPDCVMLIDADRRIVMMNRAGLLMLQSDTFEQVKGESLAPFVVPKYRKDFLGLTTNVFAGDSGTLQFELLGIHGRSLWLEMHAVPFRNEKNEIVALLAISRDVTEQRKLEEQLRQSQKMEVVGTLAGGLAHDFNNVLGGIMGTASLLRMQVDKGTSFSKEHMCAKLDVVIELSTRAADIVAQLMVISRKQEASLAPVDLRSVIKHVIAICRNTFDKSIEIATNLPDEPVMINADSVQIEQVLLNLCINASHAMTIMRQEGEVRGGELGITAERLQMDKYCRIHHPAARENSEYWVLSVRDTGVGIDTQMISRIFDPFFTTKEKGKGTGLGLSMVYNIVQQHQGFINVYSEPGTGTTFSAYLPVLVSDTTPVAEHSSDDIPLGEGLLLVVDDELFIRQAAKSILEECGYQVLLAENGEAAVAIFREHGADIKAVVMDMIMPKKSGMDAYLEIRQIKPEVKILFASGFMQDERIVALTEMGIRDFIKKPYSMRMLAVAVASIMAG